MPQKVENRQSQHPFARANPLTHTTCFDHVFYTFSSRSKIISIITVIAAIVVLSQLNGLTAGLGSVLLTPRNRCNNGILLRGEFSELSKEQQDGRHPDAVCIGGPKLTVLQQK